MLTPKGQSLQPLSGRLGAVLLHTAKACMDHLGRNTTLRQKDFNSCHSPYLQPWLEKCGPLPELLFTAKTPRWYKASQNKSSALKTMSAHSSSVQNAYNDLHPPGQTDILQRKWWETCTGTGRLISRMQVDEDVDGRNDHFGKDEYDDNPFEKFALLIVSLYYQLSPAYYSHGSP